MSDPEGHRVIGVNGQPQPGLCHCSRNEAHRSWETAPAADVARGPMAEQDALDCAARRREREANPVDPALYVCRCDHAHPPGVTWCDLCEYPLAGSVVVSARELVGPDGHHE